MEGLLQPPLFWLWLFMGVVSPNAFTSTHAQPPQGPARRHPAVVHRALYAGVKFVPLHLARSLYVGKHCQATSGQLQLQLDFVQT